MKTAVFLPLIILSLCIVSCNTKNSLDPKVKDSTLADRAKDSVELQTISFLKSLNKTDLLETFLKPVKIVNDTAFWKQDLESIQMKTSDDDYIHTVVDTIFNLGTTHIILFAAYETFANGEIHYCHPCNADYSIAHVIQEGDHYKIKSFKKHLTTKGTMGQGARVSIVEFKDSNKNILTSLKFEDGWIGGGTIMSAAEYFNTEDFSSLIYIETHNSNEGICDETDFKCINKTERELIPFDRHPSTKPAIIIKYKHTYFDKKLIIIEKTDTLIYDGYHFNKDAYYEGV